MRMHRHHLLEIILWPNGDGTFRKILNTKERLKELEIYDDWKLTITIPADEHIRMHANNRSAATKRKLSAALKGIKRSVDTKAKISAAKKGKKFTAEHRAKLSAANKGKKLTAEHRAKLSAAQKSREFTAEHRAKLSAAKKGNTNAKKCKKC